MIAQSGHSTQHMANGITPVVIKYDHDNLVVRALDEKMKRRSACDLVVWRREYRPIGNHTWKVQMAV